MAELLWISLGKQLLTLQEVQPIALWLLEFVLLGGIIWGLWKLQKPGVSIGNREIKWAVLLALLVFPFNVLVHFESFEGQILTARGSPIQPEVFLLGLIPAFAAVGLVGPIPAVIFALAAGLIQTFLFGQDPLNGLMVMSTTVLFIWLSSQTVAKGSGESKHSPFINGLLAFVYALPVLLLLRLIVLLSFGEKDLIALLEQFLLSASTFFPSTLLASAVSQALSRWNYAEWNPFKFINEYEALNALTKAANQLEKFTVGKFDQELDFKPRSAGEIKFYQALEGLRDALRLREDTQSRLLSLDPSYYSREAYDLLLSSILRAALGREASSARLILYNPTLDPDRREMRLRLGQGEQTRVYAYLDVMVMEKLGNQDQLILSDIKLDQYFGLSAEMPYPQSIAALSLKSDGNSQGVLWVGFEQNRWFSEEDIRFYQQLAYRAAAALSTKERYMQLQNEKTWLEAAFQALAEPVVILNSADKIVFTNAAARQSLLKEPGKALHNLKDLQTSFPDLVTVLKKPLNPNGTNRINLAKGLDYEVRILPLKTEEGQSGKAVFLNDTAEQKRLNAQKSEFVTNISHDLLSPLQLMRGYVTLLKNIGNLSEEQEKYIGRIQMSIDNMSGLVSKVMSMEMLDANEEVKFTPFDVKEMIEDVVSTLDLLAQQHKVSIHTDLSGLRNTKMLGDRLLLRQAVFNLVENAIKFNHLGGEVWVSASKDANALHLTVKDNGKGIAPLDQPKIFMRYFHVEDADSLETPGPGLGLAIVKSIVEKHAGKINVQSQLGEGSTFSIDIPLRK